MTKHFSERKDVVVILNGISLRKKIFYHSIFPALSQICNLEVYETLSKNDGIMLASKAADKYVDLILAAGGDGTLNQVLNGVLRGRENEPKFPVIGLIPIGTGNDFAKAVGATADATRLIELVTAFTPKKLDVGLIGFTGKGGSENRYFVNIADLGMGPVVVDKVLKSGRAFGHGLAYYMSILSTFLTYKPMRVKAETAGWTWEGKLRTLGVANAKFYGHGLCIAPDAALDDRMLEVFICGNVSVLDFIRQTSNLKKGKYISLTDVHYKKATSIHLSSESSCLIEADGEILGELPASVSLFERQLEFLI